MNHTTGEPPSGANARVYEARAIKSQRQVAVKVFSPREEPATPDHWEHLRRSFKNEIRKTALARHWSVVDLLDWGEAKLSGLTIPFIIMEWAPKNLREPLDRGSLGWGRSLFACAQLSEVVSYVNHRGLVHRDIKPENLVLSKDDALKLADLGIAAILPDFEKAALLYYSESIDTRHPRHYFSPEQLALAVGEKDVDLSRSDLYQVGKVCHELLVGVNPTGQLNRQDKAYQGLPANVRDVLLGLLAEKPVDRPPLETFTGILYLALRDCLRRVQRVHQELAGHDNAMACLRHLFAENTSAPIPQAWSMKIGLEKLAQHQLAHFNRYARSGTASLNPLGIDLRNQVLGRKEWLNFLDFYYRLARAPEEDYALTAGQLAASRLVRRQRQWYRPRRDSLGGTQAEAVSGNSRYIVPPPLRVGDHWWAEIYKASGDSEERQEYSPDWPADTAPEAWQEYAAPWRVELARTARGALAAVRKRLKLDDAVFAEILAKLLIPRKGSGPVPSSISLRLLDQLAATATGRTVWFSVRWGNLREGSIEVLRCAPDEKVDRPEERFDDLLWDKRLKLHEPLHRWDWRRFLEHVQQRNLIVPVAYLQDYFERTLEMFSSGYGAQFQITPDSEQWKIALIGAES